MNNHENCFRNCGRADCSAPNSEDIDEIVYGEIKKHHFKIVVDGKELKYPMLRLLTSWILMILLGFILAL